MLHTQSRTLTYSLPEVETDPTANVYYSVNLGKRPPGFKASRQGGVVVPLYSDLKRHDMGPGLAESFGSPLDSQFITARLWGVADTAPYLHDGRAHTLEEAILMHGGEAKPARDAFAALPDRGKEQVIGFLLTLRTPRDPASDILGAMKKPVRIECKTGVARYASAEGVQTVSGMERRGVPRRAGLVTMAC